MAAQHITHHTDPQGGIIGLEHRAGKHGPGGVGRLHDLGHDPLQHRVPGAFLGARPIGQPGQRPGGPRARGLEGREHDVADPVPRV